MLETTKAHLFGTKGEHFAFFLAEAARTDNGITLLVKDVILIPDDDMMFEDFSAQIKLDALLHLTNTANRRKMALIEIHNHGFAFGDGVDFSTTDRNGFKEFVPYVLDVLPNRPYAALVLTPEESVQGLLWQRKERSEHVSSVKIVGANFRKLMTTSAKRFSEEYIEDNVKLHERQVLAFGEEGQRKIASVKVAIIGSGGIGSHVAQQLAYLGVLDFTIVDPDLIEDTNLNRLVGAMPTDIGKPKVNVMERMIHAITNNKADVTIMKRDLRSAEVLDALKGVDVIFGCIDNDGARLILNELACSYLVHYIDCGTGINLENDKVVQAGGQVMVVHPDGPCLMCANMIDRQEAYDSLAPAEEFENRKRLGYVKDVDIPAPSVVSLNGVVASIAVTEFIMLVTGLRVAKVLTVYDMLEGRESALVPRLVKIDEKCLHRSYLGSGDKIHFERYLRTDKGVMKIG